MSGIFESYLDKYQGKPNPSTGRSFWYTDEIAKAEGWDPKDVDEVQRFYQTFVGDAKIAGRSEPTRAEAIAAWEKYQYDKAHPQKQPQPYSPTLSYPGRGVYLNFVTVAQLELIIAKVLQDKGLVK